MGAQMEINRAGYCSLEKRGCGGCPMLSLPYEEQLRRKQARLEELLGEFGPVAPILGMEHPWHYRNKVISSFAWGPGKALISGIYAQGTHRVVPVHECLLHREELDRAVAAVRQAAREFCYRPFDENRRTGLVRHVLCRHSLTTGEVLAVLVTASPVLPGARTFAARVKELCPAITTLAQNVNPRPGSAVLGDREKILYGRGYIEDVLCGVKFRISPSSFYQINPVQTQVLYSAAISAARLTRKERVLDAYCGVGTIGLSARRPRRQRGGRGAQPQRRRLRRGQRQGQQHPQRPLPLRGRRRLPGRHGRPWGEAGCGVPGPAPGGQHPRVSGRPVPGVPCPGGVYLLQPGDPAPGPGISGPAGLEGGVHPGGGYVPPHGSY